MRVFMFHMLFVAWASFTYATCAMGDVQVFLLEDDLRVRSVVVKGLREEGYAAEGFGRAAQLLARVEDRVPEVLIIDIGLPDADGRDVCRAIRARGLDTPVLFLTARSSLPDKLSGFASGGDDYLGKPFEVDELLARVAALVRRNGHRAVPSIAGLRLDAAEHTVSIAGEEVSLTPTEYRVLACLLTTGGTVGRRTLIRAGWSAGAMVHDNTLDVFMAGLRHKLARLPGAPTISTVHRVGYRITRP